MKFDGEIAGVIAGLAGTASGVSCALTAAVSGSLVQGAWLGVFGAVLGVCCAAGGVAFYYLESKRQERESVSTN